MTIAYRPIIPYDLEQKEARPLALLFLMQELLSLCKKTEKEEKNLGRLCFYCKTLLQASKMDGKQLLESLEALKTPAYKEKVGFFFRALFPFLEEEKRNENLLFFLLEKKSNWDHFLGEGSIDQLLEKLFTSSVHSLEMVISEGYAKRGFPAFYEQYKSSL